MFLCNSLCHSRFSATIHNRSVYYVLRQELLNCKPEQRKRFWLQQNRKHYCQTFQSKETESLVTIISNQTISIWCLEMAFFTQNAHKNIPYFRLQHMNFLIFSRPSYSSCHSSFDHCQTIHLLFRCVRKHVYFPFTLLRNGFNVWVRVRRVFSCLAQLVKISISSMCYGHDGTLFE